MSCSGVLRRLRLSYVATLRFAEDDAHEVRAQIRFLKERGLRGVRASGEREVALVAHVRGESCYDWCVGARDIREYLECIQKCDDGGLETTLPVNEDLSI